MTLSLQGMGMTSLRTRERMIKRLSEQGIQNKRVLEIMRDTPRHIFMDEASQVEHMKIQHCQLVIIKLFLSLI